MRFSFLTLPLLLITPYVAMSQSGSSVTTPVKGTHPAIAAQYGRLPLSFEPNRGQTDPTVKFVSHSQGCTVLLKQSSAELVLTRPNKIHSKTIGLSDHASAKPSIESSIKPETDIIKMELIGSAPGSTVMAGEQLPGTVNYFIGKDPTKWHADLPTYSKVRYAGVYSGVDLIYYGNEQRLEYDFLIAPGTDPKTVRLHFAGAKKLKLNATGNLMIEARHGTIAFQRPVVFQMKDGTRQPVKARFQVAAGNNISFKLGDYDRNRELVIDPTLAYSTYLGGSKGDFGEAIAVDASGDAYVAGYATSTTFPVTGDAYQTVQHGTTNAFVTKLNATGTALVYSTYLGGSQFDYANGIAVDSSGNAYVTGTATSLDFPVTSEAFQKVNHTGNGNAFVAKLNATGSALLYSTYLGGSGFNDAIYSYGDQAFWVAVDKKGDAYVTGSAYSHDFPVTKNAFQTVNKASGEAGTGFVTKLNPTGSALLYSTYLGGSFAGGVPDLQRAAIGNQKTINRLNSAKFKPHSDLLSVNSNLVALQGDIGAALALDAAGNAYITGVANSSDFPVTPGAFQTTNNGNPENGIDANAFVTKLNATGSALIYSTYLGGSEYDVGTAIALDSSDNAYITGGATSPDFPITPNAFQKASKTPFSDLLFTGFVTKLNASGSALVYSTYLGGTSTVNGSSVSGDEGFGIAVDSLGVAYITGFANSANFPTTSDALQTVNKAVAAGGSNGFFTQLNTDGSALIYSTYIGGNSLGVDGNEEGADAIALDSSGNVYITGETVSADFAVTANVFQTTAKQVSFPLNAFVSKFALNKHGIATRIVLSSNANPQKAGQSVTFTAQIQPLSGTGVPSGTVSGDANGSPLTEKPLSNGSASFTETDLTAGTYTIVVSYSGDSDYAPTSLEFEEVVFGPPATITALNEYGNQTFYGSPSPFYAEVLDANGIPVPGASVHFTGSGFKLSPSKIPTGANGVVIADPTPIETGALKAMATVTGASVPAVFDLTVLPAPLKVTAANVSVPFGGAIPSLSYAVTGFVNGDEPSVVSGQATETTTAKEGSPPGVYPISLAAGTLAAKNYSFNLVNGSLTITPKE